MMLVALIAIITDINSVISIFRTRFVGWVIRAMMNELLWIDSPLLGSLRLHARLGLFKQLYRSYSDGGSING